MGEQEIARAMFAAVPDAPREPVLSSVEEADDEPAGDERDDDAIQAAAEASPEPITGAAPVADRTDGSAAERRPLDQPADTPGR